MLNKELRKIGRRYKIIEYPSQVHSELYLADIVSSIKPIGEYRSLHKALLVAHSVYSRPENLKNIYRRKVYQVYDSHANQTVCWFGVFLNIKNLPEKYWNTFKDYEEKINLLRKYFYLTRPEYNQLIFDINTLDLDIIKELNNTVKAVENLEQRVVGGYKLREEQGKRYRLLKMYSDYEYIRYTEHEDAEIYYALYWIALKYRSDLKTGNNLRYSLLRDYHNHNNETICAYGNYMAINVSLENILYVYEQYFKTVHNNRLFTLKGDQEHTYKVKEVLEKLLKYDDLREFHYNTKRR